MKKEIGKWLMDIAKYLTTAVLLSSVFKDLDSPQIIIGGILSIAVTLGWGLFLIRDRSSHVETRNKTLTQREARTNPQSQSHHHNKRAQQYHHQKQK